MKFLKDKKFIKDKGIDLFIDHLWEKAQDFLPDPVKWEKLRIMLLAFLADESNKEKIKKTLKTPPFKLLKK